MRLGRFNLLLFFCLGFSVILSTPVIADPNHTFIMGTVCNLDGKPLHAGLKLQSEKSGFERPGGEAGYGNNENGEYRFDIPNEYLPDYFFLSVSSYQFSHTGKTIYITKSDSIILKDIMVEEEPRTRPWWHFKYNTGKCNAPWPF
jgi:hypothetical protein